MSLVFFGLGYYLMAGLAIGLLGYLTLGEGWHANHHEFPDSARMGLLRSQFDWIWQVILLLRLAGLASKVNVPTEHRIRRRLAE